MVISKLKYLLIAIFAVATLTSVGCEGNNDNPSDSDPNETAAKVNGTTIKMEAVERGIKQQAQGQEARLSQLELAQARLQMLDQLIQQEVLYQKADSEETMPTDEEVTAEINKLKTSTGDSQEEFNKKMQEAGETEESLKETVKKRLAIQKLNDKITGKIEPPKDSEIEAYFNGNKDAFVKKRGVRLAAIVVDPSNSGNGDTTVDEASANLKIEEIRKKLNDGADFAALASTVSEDPSRIRKGELGFISEQNLAQSFSPQIAQQFMGDNFKVGQFTNPILLQGKFYIFKLQERNEKEEKLSLESPGVREQISENLVAARKQLLSAAYTAVAMDEAKIENLLAQKVVDNPNELSGARPAIPAGSETPAAPEASGNSNANAEAAPKAEEANKPAEDKKEEAKPEDANANADPKKQAR